MKWRVVGLVLIVLSMVVLGMDLLVTLEAGTLRILSFGETWALLAGASFASVFGAGVDPAQLGGVTGFLLGLPAFAPSLIAGLALVMANPRRPRGIFRS